jgi:hypothetical protein
VILLAWLLAVGEAFAVYQYTLRSWAGYHYYDIPELTLDQQVEAGQYNVANQLLYNPIHTVWSGRRSLYSYEAWMTEEGGYDGPSWPSLASMLL